MPRILGPRCWRPHALPCGGGVAPAATAASRAVCSAPVQPVQPVQPVEPVAPASRAAFGQARQRSSRVLLPSAAPLQADIWQQRRGFVDGVVGKSEGNEMLRHLADRSSQPFAKSSLQEMLDLCEQTPEQRLQHLERTLHIGIAKIVVLLQDLPLGCGSVAPIRAVIKDYVQDLRDLRGCSAAEPELFHACILRIFRRHRGMLNQIADGLYEFQQKINTGFEPYGDLPLTDCAEISDEVPAVRFIEQALDEFFTIRTTLRLLISHCLELLRNPPAQQASDAACRGIISMSQPSAILIEAYSHAQFMCRRIFGHTVPLMMNGVTLEEYLQGRDGHSFNDPVPYIDNHLYFIFFEVVKNAMRTSIRAAGPEGPQPIHASLIAGTSLLMENERAIKISDAGEGIHRQDMRKVFSYFYSTRRDTADSATAQREALPFVRRGMGLRVSRVLVRYFGGEIDVHSIARKGTDVYIYL